MLRQMTGAILALACAAAAQDASLKAALETALRDGGEEEKVEAIRAAARDPDEGVAKLLARAMADPARAVRREAIDALGWNPSPQALEELTRNYWKNTALRDDAELFALLLKSIGRHGDAKSIVVLTDSPFQNLTLANGTARLMGLGNIRSKESVKAIVDLSKRAAPERGKGEGRGRWEEGFGTPFRVALATLTGQDFGTSRAAWQKWWGENESGFEVSAERPPAPSDVAQSFERYWGVPYGAAAETVAAATGGSPFGWIEEPTKEQVKEATAELKAAYAGGKDDEIIAAIEATAKVNDDEVIRLVSKGLSRRSAVQIAAIDALGWSKNRSALRQIHRLYHRDKDLSKKEDVFAALLKAIGRHGDKSSLEVLFDSPFKDLTVESGRARILGIANVRDNKSLEDLVKCLRLAGQPRGGRTKDPVFLEDFRLAFAVLTGVDCGASREAMDAWWRENKGFKVEQARPPLPPQLKEKWERYWGVPY
jgi:hypothetical protein